MSGFVIPGNEKTIYNPWFQYGRHPETDESTLGGLPPSQFKPSSHQINRFLKRMEGAVAQKSLSNSSISYWPSIWTLNQELAVLKSLASPP